MKRFAVLLLMAGCLVHGSLAVAQSTYGDMLRDLGGLMDTLDALDTQEGNKKEKKQEKKPAVRDPRNQVEVTLSTGKRVKVDKSVEEAAQAYYQYCEQYVDALERNDMKGMATMLSAYTKAMEKVEEMEPEMTREEETYWLDMLNRTGIMMLQSAQ